MVQALLHLERVVVAGDVIRREAVEAGVGQHLLRRNTVLDSGAGDPVQVVAEHLLVDGVARRCGNSVEVSQFCGMFGDQPLTVLLAQRLPTLLDVLVAAARRWHRDRPRLRRYVGDVVGLVHRRRQLLVDVIRLGQNLL